MAKGMACGSGNGRMVKWRDRWGRMAGMAEWRNGGRNGGTAERMAEWQKREWLHTYYLWYTATTLTTTPTTLKSFIV